MSDADGTPIDDLGGQGAIDLYIRTGTVPAYGGPEHGQVLTWSDVNGQWEPATPSGGGGGGAVDSVNGQTGVVSLGIQDMDDYAAYQNTPGITFDTWVNLGASETFSADGQVDANTGGYIYIWSGGQDFVELSLLEAGDDLTITSGDGTQTTVQVTTAIIVTGTDNTVGALRTNGTWDPAQSTPRVPVTFSSPRWGSATDIPLANGDTLQWVDAAQKFKPAQPVDTKRIQDQEDFDYSFEQVNNVNLNKTAGGYLCDADGDFSNIVNSNSVGNFFTYYGGPSNGSGGGNNKIEFDKLVAGDPLDFVFDNGVTLSTTFVSKAHNGAEEWYMVVSDDWPAGALSSQTMQVSSPKFAVNGQQMPLATGDILQWDGADGKFKPTADYISLATLKAEVAASADFADFQSRIAAL